MQNRINTRVFHTLGTTGVILLLVLSLAVGATYCRYSTLIQGQMALKAGLSPQPTLYSLDGEGTITDYAPQWQAKGGQQYQQAVLQNCNSDDSNPPRQAVSVRIRVFVPDDSDDLGNLSFTMSLNDGETVLSSAASYLGTNTPRYAEQQTQGWVYSFFQTGGAGEYIHTFPGGAISALPITVAVQNTTIDCSQFQICVERISDNAL